MTASPPTTNIEEAVTILRDLRERAVNYAEQLNVWILIDTIDEAVALLEAEA